MVMVDLYFRARRIRADVPMRGLNRVSDMFNSLPSGYLTGAIHASGSLLGTLPTTDGSATGDVVVRVRDVRVVHPIDEDLSAYPSLTALRERISVRAVLEMDAWVIRGDVHLVDRVPWVDFLAAARGKFLPVTRASVDFGDGAAPTEFSFILINAECAGAVYEIL